jgi:Outer membrane efflux protein.
LAGC